ncbi:hypothetical protein CAPTEDRAFT_78700, partial [Capitella teleta]
SGQRYNNREAGLTEIPIDISLGVTAIDLSHNSITTLGPNAFRNFTELNVLHLNYNNISFIHDDAFEGVYKLHHLSLSHNQLADFPVLPNMPKLSRLYLDNNNIRTIPDDALDVL